MCADGRLERTGRAAPETPVRQHSAAGEHAPSAAIVLIGDELLAGKITDANLQFLAVELHALGWKVLKVSVVRDDIDCIARCFLATFVVLVAYWQCAPTIRRICWTSSGTLVPNTLEVYFQ